MKTVYLIDDDPVFLYLAQRIIQTIDPTLTIATFADGELAMNRLKEIHNDQDLLPDIIFLDLNMPVMDGWEFLQNYTRFYQGAPGDIALYILSSTISPEDIERAKQYPVVLDFLIKPVDKQRLAKILLDR